MRTSHMLCSVLASLGLVSSGAVAQDGNWNIANGPVGDFAGWAAISGVTPLIGDFNNDGRDDIALVRQTAGWGSVPIAFAQGDGTWNITNGPVGDFAVWAATSGVAPLIGDFNNDGRDDIALVRQTAGWGSVPIAFAQGNGTWSIANGPVGDFAVWAATSGVAPLAGDFNNDGRDDIALVRQTAGWGSVPIAFAQGNGNWSIANGPVGDFAVWAATSGVAPLTGDFNNDGRDDIALVRGSDGWGSVPIAFAQGNGNWSIANGPVGDFAGWAAISGVTPLTGDFNNDGRDDIALVRGSDGWGSVPIAFAQGNGNWSIANGPVGDFAGWAAISGVTPLTGDFNNDGRDDIALIRRSDGWGSVPIAFAQGNGTWNITNGPVGDFAGWAATSGVAPLAGDFNNDGRDDIALIRRSDGWGSVPVAFAQSGGPTVSLRKSINALTAAELMALRRGVARMMAWNNAPRDSADYRRSWIYWANMHAHFGPACGGQISGSGMAGVQTFTASNASETATWCRCQHSPQGAVNERFLTWHRMYLWYFERVLQAAAGDASLRLPYWDYATDPTLPAAFRATTYVNEAGQTVANPLRVEARQPSLNAGTAGLLPGVRTAAAAMAQTSYTSFGSQIENVPHGAVHCSLVTGSCPNGLMGAVPASALDPIFYLHHVNIDRLYECWLRGNEATRLPTDPVHLNTQYTFVDTDGTTPTRRVGDMLRTSQLGYGYATGGDCPTVVAGGAVVVPAMAPRMAAAGETFELRGRTLLERGVTTLPIEIPPTARDAVSALATPGSGGRSYVVIDGLTFDEGPGALYNVYLQGSGGRREQIGVLQFFNATAPHHDEPSAHGEESRRYEFDATAALQRLGVQDRSQLLLVFEPTTGLTDSTPAAAAERISPEANVRFDRAQMVIEPQ